MAEQTVRDPESLAGRGQAASNAPGLVLLFSGQRPLFEPMALSDGPLVLGRELLGSFGVEDDRVSRQHVALERDGGGVRVRDLGSTNGVFLRGERVAGEALVAEGALAVLRVGRTLALVVPRVSAYETMSAHTLGRGGIVAGPSLDAVHRQIAALGRAGEGLFLRGESGSGKEIAARVYHDASPRRAGPLVPVNCAAVPRELAERLFFGAVKGAYSGSVADARGYLQAAHGGTLFLDEVAELDPGVQSKLLRALEVREVLPLGSTRPQPVELGLCAATLRDLRECVASGAFREDLYYRIGRPEVRLPPLRERLEELPFLIEQTLRAASVAPSSGLVELCLLRPWPGNVRELCSELRAAAVLARAQGSDTVQPEHLDPQAGLRLVARSSVVPAEPAATERSSQPRLARPADEGLLGEVAEVLGLARKTVTKLLYGEKLASMALVATQEGDDTQGRAALFRSAVRQSLLALLESREFNQSTVASELGVSRTTLVKLVDDMGLPRAADLDDGAIDEALARSNGDLERAAQLLQVSPAALRKRRAARG